MFFLLHFLSPGGQKEDKMKREDLYKKYHDTLKSIYEAEGKKDDTSVCLDKLIYMYRKHVGIPVAENDEYKGIPADFDWEEFGKDYEQLVKE